MGLTALSAVKQTGNLIALKYGSKNEYDANAIVIKTAANEKIGYVPQKDNIVFSRLMDAGKLLFGTVKAKELRGKWVKISIDIYLHE